MQKNQFPLRRSLEADLRELSAIRALLERQTAPVTLRFHRELQQTRGRRNDRLESPSLWQQLGVMVEIYHHGVITYAGTADVSAAGIHRTIEKARRSAEALGRHSLGSFQPEVHPSTSGTYESPHLETLPQVHFDAVDELLIETNRSMANSDRITQRVSSLQLTEVDSLTISNTGAHRHQQFAYWTTAAAATAEKENEVQTRSVNGSHSHCYQGGIENLHIQKLCRDAAQAADEALALLAAENCPSGEMDVILAPDQMLLQIHESIGHPLELDRILGDERNYAGWSFVKLEDFGQLQYGSELLNVSFDPSLRHEFAAYAFDDTGARATREMIIEKGILKRALGSLESQARSGVPGVANARAASWNRAPIDRMANLNVEPGSTSLPDLISQVENGVMMMANTSWSIDDYRDKFQFGCEIGHRIQNGKITGIVKNPNYRGRTLQFWRSLKAVGDRSTVEVYGSPYCGKGEPSQIIRVGHASPACLFAGLNVFGGGQSC